MPGFRSWIFLPLLFVQNVATAQTPETLVEGQRVRVAHRCRITRDQPIECSERRSPRMTTGQLRTLDGDSLRISTQSTDTGLVIPTAYVDRLLVVDGRRSRFWTGAGIGLLAGAAIGGVIGSTQEWCLISFGDCDDPATGLGVIIGAPAGFLIGGVVGAVIRSDRWRAVSVNDHRISVEPRPDALGLQLSVGF
jgi:hypothetical protein